MPSEINQYIKLRDVIYLYIEASRKSSSAEFVRLWRLAFRGFTQMGLNYFWQAKTVEVLLNPNNTATLPQDLLQWVRIGNFNAKGELQVLSINNNLTTYRDLRADRTTAIASETGTPISDIDLTVSDRNLIGGYYGGKDFGLGSGLMTEGQCRVDMANRVIIFGTTFSLPHVVIEYIGSPQQDNDYEIPSCFTEAMIAWLDWQNLQYIPATNKGSASGKQNAAANFKNQLMLARKIFKPIRLQEIALQQREQQIYGIKG